MSDARPQGGEYVFGKFLLVSLPGWLIALIAAVLIARIADVALWALLALVALWIVGDLATFPLQRRYFVSDPPDRKILGEHAVAVSELAPLGFVRVHGELWQARAAGSVTIHEGAELRVCGIRGLELLVEPITLITGKPQ